MPRPETQDERNLRLARRTAVLMAAYFIDWRTAWARAEAEDAAHA